MQRLWTILGVMVCFSVEATPDIQTYPINSADLIEVTGPVEVRIRQGSVTSISWNNEALSVHRSADRVLVSSETPVVLEVEGANFKSLKVRQGQVLVRLEGTERLLLPQVVAAEVRILLMDRSRFDADELTTESLRISLSGQGKASLANVSAGLFELDLRDHGDVEVSGLARSQEVELRDYAHYDGSKFRTENAEVALTDYAAGYIRAANAPTIRSSLYSSLSAR